MSSDDIDSITTKLEELELKQQRELQQLRRTHRDQKKQLLQSIAKTSKKPPQRENLSEQGHILSHSLFPLQPGDKVILRTTASIGCKGDLAIVTHVAPKRVEFRVPRLNDVSWRLPTNVSHYTSKHISEIR